MKQDAAISIKGERVCSVIPPVKYRLSLIGLTVLENKVVSDLIDTGKMEQIYTIKPGSSDMSNASKLYYPAGFTNFEPGKGYLVELKNSFSLTPTPVVTDEGKYSLSLKQLAASWVCSDPDSGVIEYQYAIGTTKGGSDAVDWNLVGIASSIAKTDLSLQPGKIYYFNVKARNGTKLGSETGSSDGIIVDNIPPVIVHTPVTLAPKKSDITFTAFVTDLETGIKWVMLTVLQETTPGAWTRLFGVGIGPPQLPDGKCILTLPGTMTGDKRLKYYIDATDMANNSAFTPQYIIERDTTPPTTPVVTDDGATTTSTTQLHAVWSSSDPESGIAQCQFAIGTSKGANDVANWTNTTSTSVTKTGLSLTSGKTYYFSVQAKNGAGIWGTDGYSDGISLQRFYTADNTSEYIYQNSSWFKATPTKGGLKFDGTTDKLYVDGVLDNSRTDGNIVAAETTKTLKIGWDTYSTARRFKGTIGEVQIYNRALSEAEINSNKTGSISRNGLILEHNYRNNTAEDISLNGNHGAISGGAVFNVISTVTETGTYDPVNRIWVKK
ncbi:MAG: LamG domain-containing protein [Candidatus Omnitrophota bacterium]